LIYPGGVAKLSSHLPKEQKIWVRIPQGCKVSKGKHSNAVMSIGLICIVFLDLQCEKGKRHWPHEIFKVKKERKNQRTISADITSEWSNLKVTSV
jgi:hypothetical protein